MLISITAFLLIINFKITCYVFDYDRLFYFNLFIQFKENSLQKLGRERMRFAEQRLKKQYLKVSLVQNY